MLPLAATTGTLPDTALGRARRPRMAVHLNIEQAVSDSAGICVRAGLADGAIEPPDFADIDRSAAAYASIDGKHSRRTKGTIGIAPGMNGNLART